MSRKDKLYAEIQGLRAVIDERTKEVEARESQRATVEEVEQSKKELDEIDAIKAEIEILERNDAQKAAFATPENPDGPTKPEPENGQIPEEKRFKTFGEQMRSVVVAEQRGSKIDPRLIDVRAVSGMSEGVNADGGFLVQGDFSTEMLKRTYETGKLPGKCRKLPISANSNKTTINGVDETSRADGSRHGGVRAYWKNEAAALTASQPKFREITLELSKLTGLYYATDELLQDAQALGAEIMHAMPEEFGFKLDDALIRGSGAGMPSGILNAGCRVQIDKETGQSAATIVTENIEKMWARMSPESKSNAVWYINNDVWPQLYALHKAVGVGGVPVFLPPGGIADAPLGALMGRPIEILEQCETLGTEGDIILADFSQYLFADKGGVSAAESIHVRFLYDETTFRFTYRCDGQPVYTAALTPFKGTDTTSPFVVLKVRA